MIRAIDLTKRYADGKLALDALNLNVDPGEIYCLLGAHGSGKTTTLDLFLNLTEPTSGRALINGIDANRQPLEAKQQIAFLMENVTLYDQLTALQNLEFFARIGGHFDKTTDDYAMAMREVGLPERCFTQRVKNLSHGMRQKLGLALALVKEAPVLLLDEPMTGLDPQVAAEFVEVLRGLRDRGKAILMATHDLFHARQLADRVGILKEGRKVLTCSSDELRYRNLETLYLDYMRGGFGLDDSPPASGGKPAG